LSNSYLLLFTKLGKIPDANKEMHPLHFGRDPDQFGNPDFNAGSLFAEVI